MDIAAKEHAKLPTIHTVTVTTSLELGPGWCMIWTLETPARRLLAMHYLAQMVTSLCGQIRTTTQKLLSALLTVATTALFCLANPFDTGDAREWHGLMTLTATGTTPMLGKAGKFLPRIQM